VPEASVIISTYNRPAHLERCLEGFRQQTELDFEIIVADDGSGGETAEVIRARPATIRSLSTTPGKKTKAIVWPRSRTSASGSRRPTT